MFFYSVINNFIILILFQVIIFNFFNLKKLWFIQTFLVYFLICIYNYDYIFNLKFVFNYFLINTFFITSYILFLTLVFNDSPSIVYIKKSKKFFMKKKFIKNRLILMKKDKLILNNRVSIKGRLVHKLIIILSQILFKES